MLLPFTKAHGTGNHFIIIYIPECPLFDLNENLISKLCNTSTGIGADGLIAISNDEKYDYKMDYYNNDGTWETMCVNGARCSAMLLKQKKIIEKEAVFVSGDGEHHIKIIDNHNVALTIFPPQYVSDEIIVENLSGFSVNSGAKHFVIEVGRNQELEWEKIGEKIRYSNQFPKGTNVNFVKKINNNTLEVITYEKGVEKIMQSCGSGSVAAAYHMQQKYNLDYNLNIKVSGGNLFITADSHWKNVWLQGEVKLLFNSIIDINTL